MALIKLYIAATLDGYIARKNHDISWLTSLPIPKDNDYGYSDFFATIDTVVMGRRTYQEILGFGVDWPYPHCKTVVVSSNTQLDTPTPNTVIAHKVDTALVEELKSSSVKDIWVVGGGEVITAFLSLQVLDEMTLTFVPLLLGNGIRLFPENTAEQWFELVKTEAFSTGLVNLHYKKK